MPGRDAEQRSVAMPQAAFEATVADVDQTPFRWLTTLATIGSLSGARFAAPLLRLAVPVWISRVLGVEGLGDYQLVMSYYAIYGAVTTLGLWDFVVREMAAGRQRAGKLLVHAYVLSIVAAVPATLAMGLTSLSYGEQTRGALLIMSAAVCPAAISLYADGALLAFERGRYVAALMLGEEALLTAVACGVLWLGGGLNAVVAAVVAVRTAAAVLRVAITARLTGGLPLGLDPSLVREMLRQVPVFFGATVLSTVFTRLDLVMLSWLGTATQVGLYAAALRFVNMCQEVPAAALMTLFPRLAALHVESRAAFRRVFTTSATYLALFALATSIAGTLAGPTVLRTLFGSKFDESIPILQLLIWCLLPFSLMKLLGSSLIATHNQVADLVINAVLLVVHATLMVLLIPPHGPLGAAAATLVTMTLAVLMRGRFLLQRMKLGAARARMRAA